MKKLFTVLVKEVCITNDCGGTEILPEGRYEVEVTKTWHDYETGQRGVGKLVDPKDIETARKAGTCNITEKDLKDYDEKSRKQWLKQLAKTKKEFDPARVYFSFFDIIKQ